MLKEQAIHVFIDELKKENKENIIELENYNNGYKIRIVLYIKDNLFMSRVKYLENINDLYITIYEISQGYYKAINLINKIMK